MRFEAAPFLLSTITVEPIEFLALFIVALAGLGLILGARREATIFAAIVGALVLVLAR